MRYADLLTRATTALLAWARGRLVLAGVLLGLAVAAKFYPVLFLWPLFLLCVRAGRLRAFPRSSHSRRSCPTSPTRSVLLGSGRCGPKRRHRRFQSLNSSRIAATTASSWAPASPAAPQPSIWPKPGRRSA